MVEGPRRQNPHMHLFEALLNLWMNTRDPRYLERAGEIFDLFARRFFEPKAGVLLEYFDDALAPAAGADRRARPSLRMDLAAALVRARDRHAGRAAMSSALLAHVERHGIDPVRACCRTSCWPTAPCARPRGGLADDRSHQGLRRATAAADRAEALADRLHTPLPVRRGARRLDGPARRRRAGPCRRLHAGQHALSPAGRPVPSSTRP